LINFSNPLTLHSAVAQDRLLSGGTKRRSTEPIINETTKLRMTEIATGSTALSGLWSQRIYPEEIKQLF
ncbi:MAG: hypothetical protein U9P70_03875, partial [Patescibacteria group bacterium]|nr:hypothetical protein [Patescibacteria group bacterium]